MTPAKSAVQPAASAWHAPDLDRAEVDRERIEGGLGRALEGADREPGVAVRPDRRVVQDRG